MNINDMWVCVRASMCARVYVYFIYKHLKNTKEPRNAKERRCRQMIGLDLNKHYPSGSNRKGRFLSPKCQRAGRSRNICNARRFRSLEWTQKRAVETTIRDLSGGAPHSLLHVAALVSRSWRSIINSGRHPESRDKLLP